MLSMMMSLEQYNYNPAKHNDLAPSVSYSLNEVYANADTDTTTEYLVRC